jgi:rhodanese-related sulfurtransferase
MSRLHQGLAATAAMLALAAALIDARPAVGATDLAADIEAERDHISAIDLAERIVRGDAALQVLDLRPAEEFERFHIPGASPITLDDLARTTFPRNATIVLYSEGGTHSAQGWMLLRLRGHRNVYFLREGIYEWIARVHEPKLASDATPAERDAFEQAATLSRFFGGVPTIEVSRAELPVGYWTGQGDRHEQPSRTGPAIAAIRRRGC